MGERIITGTVEVPGHGLVYYRASETTNVTGQSPVMVFEDARGADGRVLEEPVLGWLRSHFA